MDGNLPTLTTRPLTSLRVWPGNPRKTIPDLTDLTASIRRLGVLSPLLIRPLATPDGDVTHEVIAGQCRYLAAGLAGLDEVPVNEREVDDCVALEIALTENAGREAPSPLEEAEALDTMVRVHHRTPQQIADKLGRPLRWVERRLSLLKLVPAARDWLRAGRLPLAHAMQLAALDPSTQARVVQRYENAPEVPAAKSFAHEISYQLCLIGSAPFDTADAKLPGGSCVKCTKRSDAQVDLFDTGRESGAHCLDVECWKQKVAANVERAKKNAAKHSLPVYEGDAAHAVVQENWDGRVVDAWGSTKLSVTRPNDDAKPVGVAVTERGRVVDLYPKPAETKGDEDDEHEEDLNDEERAEQTERMKRIESRNALRLERIKATAALPLDQLGRLAAACTPRYGSTDGFNAMGLDIPAEDAQHDAWAREVNPDTVVRAVLTSWVTDYVLDECRGEGDKLSKNSAPLVLELLGPIYGVEQPEEPEPPPAPKGKKGSKKAKTAEVVTPATPVTNPSEEPSAEASSTVVTDKAPSIETVRVWIHEREWDGLAADDRDALEEPIGGQTIAWQGTEGFVYADVPRDEVLVALRGEAEASGITLHEGVEQPVEAPKAKRAKKASTKAEGLTNADVAAATPHETDGVPRELPAQRVLIVHDKGGDALGGRKGLAAWSAEKTPGAGAQSGGDLRPLVMLHTPIIDSGDVGTLLARYAKVKRPVLDLGVIAGEDIEAHNPSRPEIRARWNAAHPADRVEVPEAPKAPRPKRGGAK